MADPSCSSELEWLGKFLKEVDEQLRELLAWNSVLNRILGSLKKYISSEDGKSSYHFCREQFRLLEKSLLSLKNKYIYPLSLTYKTMKNLSEITTVVIDCINACNDLSNKMVEPAEVLTALEKWSLRKMQTVKIMTSNE